MKNITITDATLLAISQQHDRVFTHKEKVEIARILDDLNVDVICLAPIVNEMADTVLTRTIASVVHGSILSIPAGHTTHSIDVAWNAISKADHPRLRIALPVSTVQMEYLYGKKAEKMLVMISELISYCRSLCDNVEFVAEDATRAESDFLYSAIEGAIAAGATSVTLCDTAGSIMPDELGELIGQVAMHVPSVCDVTLGVQCHDDLHMAAACAISAVRECADGTTPVSDITVTIDGGIAPTIEHISDLIQKRGDYLDLSCRLRSLKLRHAVSKIRQPLHSTEEIKEDIRDSGVVFDISDTLEDITLAAKKLGYDLSDEDCRQVYESFRNIAAKKEVDIRELEHIIKDAAIQVPATYKLVKFTTNSGNDITAMACVELEKDGGTLKGFSIGDGAIDAAFMAIEQITGRHFELDSFQLRSVTEGHEAMGDAVVKLRSDGKSYQGTGLSTDIIGASIRAYISALNTIVYEEAQR